MINDGRYPDYPLFKGLQRPLELMGLQGRYIYWAAGVAGGAIVGFIAAYCLMGFVAGLVVLATVLSAGIVLIILKQRKGLHSKNVKRGVYVYAYISFYFSSPYVRVWPCQSIRSVRAASASTSFRISISLWKIQMVWVCCTPRRVNIPPS